MNTSLLFENDLKALLPEVFLVFTICGLLVFGSVYATRVQGEKGSPILLSPMVWLCAQTLFLGSLLNLNGLFQAGPLLYGTLYLDTLTATSKAALFFTGALTLISSRSYLRREGIFAFEYPLLILLSSLGMGLLLSSYDLLSLYLALELQSLALYVLATFKRGSAYSTEAGLKYFIVGAFASGLLLFGISLIYGSTGTTHLEDLSRLLLSPGEEASLGLLGGLLFLSVGLLFKLAAAPFHMWIPDVYEGAPSSSTMFFAAVPKLALLVILIRLYYLSFYDLIAVWQSLLVFVSASSMVVAALGALYQRKIKRFLAYSSIGHVGYLLIALSSGSLEGLQALMVYTFVYMLMTVNIWSILLSSSRSSERAGDSGPMKYMDELLHLGKMNPSLGASLGVVIFSMAGIPPMAGFMAKMYLFFVAMESSLYGLAILGVLTSVLGAFYYLRWVKIIFFERSYPKINPSYYHYEILVDREKALIIAGTTFFLLFFFLHPGSLLILGHQMALSIC